MRRWLTGLFLLLAAPAEAASVVGIWGIARDSGPDCQVLVLVLRAGTYTKAMLDIGTTKGPRDTIAGTSTYRVAGDRVEVAPSFSLGRPEPRQVFVWDRASDILVRQRPVPRLTYKRCPDRPLRPMER
jgi:hypothetical protein